MNRPRALEGVIGLFPRSAREMGDRQWSVPSGRNGSRRPTMRPARTVHATSRVDAVDRPTVRPGLFAACPGEDRRARSDLDEPHCEDTERDAVEVRRAGTHPRSRDVVVHPSWDLQAHMASWSAGGAR